MSNMKIIIDSLTVVLTASYHFLLKCSISIPVYTVLLMKPNPCSNPRTVRQCLVKNLLHFK